MEMTSRERLMTAIRKGTPDRVPVKIWALLRAAATAHESYRRVIEEALRRTDLVDHWGTGAHWFLSANPPPSHVEERPVRDEWMDVTTTYETPDGPLTRVDRRNIHGKPGIRREGILKCPEDWRRILSVPYETPRADLSEYEAKDREIGDRGIVMISAGGHPMYNI